MFDCIVPLGLKGKQSIVTSNNDRPAIRRKHL